MPGLALLLAFLCLAAFLCVSVDVFPAFPFFPLFDNYFLSWFFSPRIVVAGGLTTFTGGHVAVVSHKSSADHFSAIARKLVCASRLLRALCVLVVLRFRGFLLVSSPRAVRDQNSVVIDAKDASFPLGVSPLPCPAVCCGRCVSGPPSRFAEASFVGDR